MARIDSFLDFGNLIRVSVIVHSAPTSFAPLMTHSVPQLRMRSGPSRAPLFALSSCHRVSTLGAPHPLIELIFWGNVLSAWVESAWLWHLVSEFAVRAEPPGEGCESQDHGSEDGSVDLPVRRLGVPATSW